VTGYHPSGFGGITDFAGGTDVYPLDAAPCYVAGSRILTVAGEVPVEALRPGDLAPAGRGLRLRRVVWVGTTRIDLGRHAEPAKVVPVRIAADAFAPGAPRRDLVVSPDHAVWTDGALVPAYLLVNGRTIRREPALGAVTYVHVELDAHDLLIAEGLAAESYLDTGNRGLFAGVAGGRPLQADLMADINARAWDERACAPLALGGAIVAAAHRRLAVRAAALGHALGEDPALHLVAAGRDLATRRNGADVEAVVPAGVTSVTLRSLSAVPREVDATREDDRRLGVALGAAWLDGAVLELDGAACGGGFHGLERAGGTWLRWTDVAGVLLLPAAAAARTLRLRLVPGLLGYVGEANPARGIAAAG